MTEFGLIDRISAILASTLPKTSKRVERGIGDDAAVLTPSRGRPLLCSDMMVEGVHFDLSFASAEDVGHKALASALSDIAAMNGRPVAALVSLAIPKTRSHDFIDGFYRGAAALCAEVSCEIVGGDLSSSPNGIVIDVACYGETDQPILRAGAKPGDVVAVSGHPGASAAGLHQLKAKSKPVESLRLAHLRPKPRFDLLAAPDFAVHCTSMIDISDGLASELAHLATSSDLGFEIQSSAIPLHPDAISIADRDRALEWALSGGEDYELLATFMPGAALPPGFTQIGRAVAGGLTLVQPDGSKMTLTPRGFDHFSS